MSPETNRYGELIEQSTIEEVLADLLKMPETLVYAICASLIVEHESYTWQTDRDRISKAFLNGELE